MAQLWHTAIVAAAAAGVVYDHLTITLARKLYIIQTLRLRLCRVDICDPHINNSYMEPDTKPSWLFGGQKIIYFKIKFEPRCGLSISTFPIQGSSREGTPPAFSVFQISDGSVVCGGLSDSLEQPRNGPLLLQAFLVNSLTLR